MPDIRDNTGTISSMGANATFSNTLEVAGDRDWVRVSLQSGQTIQINLDGVGTGALSYPYLRLYDANGSLVGFNDDGGNAFNSQLTFNVNTSGNYYIEAAAWSDVSDGDYRITTQEVAGPPPPPPAGPLANIAWGTRLEGDVINVYFAPSGQTYDGYTSEGFNAYERGQITEVLSNLEAIIDVDFNITTNADQADLVFVLDMNEILNELDPYLGHFNPPSTAGAGIGVFNGDLWDRISGGDLERGGYGYVTVVHELLHGLGLAHPHDNGGTSTVMLGVQDAFFDYGSFDLNQGIFTIMSYNSGYFTGTDGSAPANRAGGDFGFEGGPMALDIAYLQHIYGTNTNTAGGNTVYTLPNASAGGTYWEAIWDTGGTDTIRYNGGRATTIDLREATLQYETGGGGFVSSADGVAGGYTIANGVVIENVVGGSGSDAIRGNAANNVLRGNNGHDTIVGGNGNDRVFGGNGDDRLLGNNGADYLFGGSGDDYMNGGSDNDRLYGNDGNDTIYGADGYDRLVGQDGNDQLIGGSSSDRFFGGAGRDVMTGNGGRDGFSFVSASDSAVGFQRDVITDFDGRFDVINLRVIDANENISGNQVFDYIGGAGVSGTAGEVWIADLGADVIVSGDTDGDGRADFEIMVLGTGTMEANDFLL